MLDSTQCEIYKCQKCKCKSYWEDLEKDCQGKIWTIHTISLLWNPAHKMFHIRSNSTVQKRRGFIGKVSLGWNINSTPLSLSLPALLMITGALCSFCSPPRTLNPFLLRTLLSLLLNIKDVTQQLGLSTPLNLSLGVNEHLAALCQVCPVLHRSCAIDRYVYN